MKKEVIVISWVPLSKKVYDELCLSEYAKWYHTEYLDLSNFYYQGIAVNNYKPYNNIYEVKSNSYIQIYNYLRSKNILYVVMHIPLTSRTFFLYFILKILNIDIIFYAIGYTPMSDNAEYCINAHYLLNYKSYVKLLKKVIRKFLIITNCVAKPRYTFCAGEVARLNHFKSSISFNSDDYEKSKIYNNTFKSNTCVFLDSYLPWHPDFKSLGINLVDQYKYLHEINRFFDQIELGGDIVKIAAHPKASYSNNEYCNREIFYDNTAKLVAEAKFVLAHTSTAINFAVLFKKPIVLIYNNDYYNLYKDSYYSYLLKFSKVLSCNIINISNPIKYNFNLDIDENAYNNYIRKYITENINGEANKDIIRKIIN